MKLHLSSFAILIAAALSRADLITDRQTTTN